MHVKSDSCGLTECGAYRVRGLFKAVFRTGTHVYTTTNVGKYLQCDDNDRDRNNNNYNNNDNMVTVKGGRRRVCLQTISRIIMLLYRCKRCSADGRLCGVIECGRNSYRNKVWWRGGVGEVVTVNSLGRHHARSDEHVRGSLQ